MVNAVWNPNDVVAASISDCTSSTTVKIDIHLRTGTILTFYTPSYDFQEEGSLDKMIKAGYINTYKRVDSFSKFPTKTPGKQTLNW